MKSIVWITDGANWGWDIRAELMSQYLPEFKHFMVARNEQLPSGREVVAYAESLNTDLIMCFAPSLLPLFTCALAKVIVCLPGQRAVKGIPCQPIQK